MEELTLFRRLPLGHGESNRGERCARRRRAKSEAGDHRGPTERKGGRRDDRRDRGARRGGYRPNPR